MYLQIPFGSVHDALSWYYNREWIKKGCPAPLRSTGFVKVQSSPRRDDVERVVDVVLKMESLIEKHLTARQQYVIYALYRRRGGSQAEVAIMLNLAGGERSVRYLRDNIINCLEELFLKAGVIKKYEGDPVYAKEEERAAD